MKIQTKEELLGFEISLYIHNQVTLVYWREGEGKRERGRDRKREKISMSDRLVCNCSRGLSELISGN